MNCSYWRCYWLLLPIDFKLLCVYMCVWPCFYAFSLCWWNLIKKSVIPVTQKNYRWEYWLLSVTDAVTCCIWSVTVLESCCRKALPIGVPNYSRIHVCICAIYVLFPLSITFNTNIGNIGNIYKKALGSTGFSCFRMSCRLERTETTGNIFLLPMNCALHPIGNTPEP